MYVTWQTIITVSAVIAAIVAIARYYNKGYDWVKTQNKQEKEINAIKTEQELLTFGVLACLKGMKEQLGCDGTVTEAINKIEHHLNAKAHS